MPTYILPPDNIVAGQSGHIGHHNNISDDLAALQGGLQYFTGGGTINTATITAAIAAGFNGIFLDPLFVWTISGPLVFNGVQNFLIESRMVGSIGWSGNISYNVNGYINTGSTQDGVQVYASNPTGAPTQGVIFKNCVLVGSNTRAVVHLGGGQRRCGFHDTLVYNTNSSAGAYAVVNGSALSDNNSEYNIFSFTGGGGLAGTGSGAALGIGVADQTQRANDTWYYGLTTAGGAYSIEKDNGGNHTFVDFYDRSNPTTAVIHHHGGGRMTFIGGEDQNTSAPSYLIDNSSTYTHLFNRTITAAGTNGGTTVSISAGTFVMRGSSGLNASQTFVTTGTPTLDLSDTALSLGNATITGTAATVVIAGSYNPNSGPILSSFTGTVTYPNFPQVVLGNSSGSLTNTTTLTFSPGTAQVRFRADLMVRVLGGGGTVNTAISYHQQNSNAVTAAIPMWQMNGAATVPTYTMNTSPAFYYGTWHDRTSAAGSAITTTLTPVAGTSYQYEYTLERLS